MYYKILIFCKYTFIAIDAYTKIVFTLLDSVLARYIIREI